MSKSGPILILEDDRDDRDFMEKIFDFLEVSNERIYFENGLEAYTFLTETNKSTFLIFSDVNLPGRNGLELKRDIDNDPVLRAKSIPFVFYSTSANREQIDEAYHELTIQGFFKKENNLAEAKKMVGTIIDYWKLCKHPNM